MSRISPALVTAVEASLPAIGRATHEAEVAYVNGGSADEMDRLSLLYSRALGFVQGETDTLPDGIAAFIPPMSGGSPYATRETGWHTDGCLCKRCAV